MTDMKNETDFHIREWNPLKVKDEGFKITFKNNPPEDKAATEYIASDQDWYMFVAITKADKVKIDRHLITAKLLLRYRWAIREGYQHQLDKNLRSRWDEPRNGNTIKGILGYIERIEKASDEEMQQWEK